MTEPVIDKMSDTPDTQNKPNKSSGKKTLPTSKVSSPDVTSSPEVTPSSDVTRSLDQAVPTKQSADDAIALNETAVETTQQPYVAPVSASAAPAKSGLSVFALLAGMGGIGLGAYALLNPAETIDSSQFAKMDQIQALDDSKTHLQSQISTLQQQLGAINSMPQTADLSSEIKALQAQFDTLKPQIDNLSQQTRQNLDGFANKLDQASQMAQSQTELATVAGSEAKQALNMANSVDVKLKEQQLATQSALKDVELVGQKLMAATDIHALTLSEIHFLLRMADHRLRFGGDINESTRALQLAQARLQEVQEPRFSETSTRLHTSLAELQRIPTIDKETIAAKLYTLIPKVTQLPLMSNVAVEKQRAEFEKAIADPENRAWYQRGWDSVKGGLNGVGNGLKSLVVIRRERVQAPEFMAQEDAFFLSQNIALQLNAARNSALEGRTQSYQDSLSAARQWLVEYYNGADAEVALIIAEIDQLKAQVLTVNLPDLTPALKAFEAAMQLRAENAAVAPHNKVTP